MSKTLFNEIPFHAHWEWLFIKKKKERKITSVGEDMENYDGDPIYWHCLKTR